MRSRVVSSCFWCSAESEVGRVIAALSRAARSGFFFPLTVLRAELSP